MSSNSLLQSENSQKNLESSQSNQIFEFPKIENCEQDPETQKLKELLSQNAIIIKDYELTDKNLENLRSILSQNENENELETRKKANSNFFITNIVLTTRVKKLVEENEKLKIDYKNSKINSQLDPNYNEQGIKRMKRKRRLKEQVNRNFKCVVSNCNKAYGSENSLNQHIKLKHFEFWNKIKNANKKNNDSLDLNLDGNPYVPGMDLDDGILDGLKKDVLNKR